VFGGRHLLNSLPPRDVHASQSIRAGLLNTVRALITDDARPVVRKAIFNQLLSFVLAAASAPAASAMGAPASAAAADRVLNRAASWSLKDAALEIDTTELCDLIVMLLSIMNESAVQLQLMATEYAAVTAALCEKLSEKSEELVSLATQLHDLALRNGGTVVEGEPGKIHQAAQMLLAEPPVLEQVWLRLHELQQETTAHRAQALPPTTPRHGLAHF
jgi:hypothetical protein